MLNATKTTYAVEIIDLLEKSKSIVEDARSVTYVDFSSIYRQALADLDYDDFGHHSIDVPVYTKDLEDDEPVEVISCENPFAYGSDFTDIVEGLSYTHYNFRDEESFKSFIDKVVLSLIETKSSTELDVSTVDLQTTVNEMFETTYNLKEMLQVAFITDCVSKELETLFERVQTLNLSLLGESFLIDPALIYKPFEDSVFYESSKCW